MTKTRLTVRLSPSTVDKIKETCETRNISQAQLIEELIEQKDQIEFKIDKILKILERL